MDVLSAVLDLFEQVGSWFPTFMTDVSTIFYTPAPGDGGSGSLTFFGVLAVCGLAFSVIFLVIGVISNFLHFRG